MTVKIWEHRFYSKTGDWRILFSFHGKVNKGYREFLIAASRIPRLWAQYWIPASVIAVNFSKGHEGHNYFLLRGEVFCRTCAWKRLAADGETL